MINWQVILSIAKTHLVSKRKQTITAGLGVTFGIGAYITLVCFMTGLNGMLDSLILDQTPHIHIFNEIEPSQVQPLEQKFKEALTQVHSVRPKQRKKNIHNAFPLIQNLTNNSDVMAALPQVNTQIFYVSGAIELGGNLTGMLPNEEVTYFNFDKYIISGTSQALENIPNSILLGVGIAEKMSLSVGDRVQISTANGTVQPLKIVGLFQSGIAEIDNVFSFSTVKTVQQLLGEPKSYITDINVKLFDMEKAFTLSRKLEKQHNLKAIDIKTANAQFETGTTIRNLITYSVSITLLIVAGFGIYNILNMLIYEKMNDIAILKATGFSGRDVQYIFMSQAIIIGILGGCLGLVLGFLLSLAIDNTPFDTQALPTITTYPVNHDPVFYIIGIVFALIATFFAGYLPARKARKIDPVQIIRGQ
ncbi:FtsX-like permease family protein [uncultured Dokdonia sp.]|uniref:ABC transporter permease n=1 Tax=uncultured Dokdonia sp. TaxID=575653 RepID=UPI00263167B6|nr:FtsX-like permease family protein [uncultured Dokdonia sp.]